MPAPVSFPGVYVEEERAIALNISSGNTCVPLFTFNPFVEVKDKLDKFKSLGLFDKAIKVIGWTDYLTQFKDCIDEIRGKHTASIMVVKSLDAIPVDTLAAKNFVATESYYRQMNAIGFYPMQHYFENGGGPCYLYLCCYETAPRGAANIRELPRSYYDTDATRCDFSPLAPQVSAFSDITVLCLGGDDAVNKKAYLAVTPLLLQAQGTAAPLFCVVHADNQGRARPTFEVKTQTAAYYPYLKTPYVLSLNELNPQNVYFEGYHGSKVQDPVKDYLHYTLDEMQNDPKGVDFAREAIKTLQRPVVLPPVYAVLGAYCRTDSERGVWKAPANITLNGVKGLCDEFANGVSINDTQNGELLDAGINAIRFLPGQGYVIWGARTMVPANHTEWRYIPVRRLFNIAERDIKKAIADMLFEPNTPATWEIIRNAIDVYLHDLWSRGALFGDSAEEAYFVKAGLGSTMSQDDISQGKMIIKVGMAAVKPAEFIVLEFSQQQR